MKNALTMPAFALLAILIALPVTGQMLTAGSPPALCGKTVRVPVTIAGASGLVALEMRLEFDPAVLTAKSVSTGDLTSGFYVASNLTAGSAKIAMASGTAANGSGPVAVITFEVAPGAAGEAAVTIRDVLVNDVRKEAAAGVVTIACPEPAKPDATQR